MKILVTGSCGLIGSALVKTLAANGHDVVRLLRKNAADGSPSWDPENGVVDLADAGSVAAVIHLAADNIAEGRWCGRKKARILNSRVKGTKLLADFFSSSHDKPRVIVSASAVGVYGDCGDELVDETGSPGTCFLADVARQWEGATASAVGAGIRVVNVRFGVVLSATGGALKKMLLPFKMGLGGVIGSGKQYISWVSIDDVVEAIQHVIATDSVCGPVNLVSPNPVRNCEFTKILGRVLRRPTIFRIPAFALRTVLGEMADHLLLASIRVEPRKLTESGYRFLYPELEGALIHILKGAAVLQSDRMPN